MKVLLIEDSEDMLQSVAMAFKFRWPEAILITATEGEKGIEMVETHSPDIVLLDINLPDIEGFDVLQQIRLFSDIPIIILSAREKEMDKVKGLEMGADDYIVKPFSVLDLLSRVKTTLRRCSKGILSEDTPPFVRGNLSINFQSREVTLDSESIHLTPTEFQILYHLVRNEGKFLNHQTLEQKLWGSSGNNDPSTIRRYVYQLRSKLKDNPPKMLISERGRGYKFASPQDV